MAMPVQDQITNVKWRKEIETGKKEKGKGGGNIRYVIVRCQDFLQNLMFEDFLYHERRKERMQNQLIECSIV